MSMPRLSPTQLEHARTVVDASRDYVIGTLERPEDYALRAADVALAVCMVESGLLVYANRSVPGSIQLPHDAVGDDHASVGLFQQQVPGWGSVRRCQTPRSSALHFYRRLFRLDWRGRSNGQLAQAVQVSAYPDRYQQRDEEAIALCRALWR